MAKWLKHKQAWDYRIPGTRAVKAFAAGSTTYEPNPIVTEALDRKVAEVVDKPGSADVVERLES